MPYRTGCAYARQDTGEKAALRALRCLLLPACCARASSSVANSSALADDRNRLAANALRCGVRAAAPLYRDT